MGSDGFFSMKQNLILFILCCCLISCGEEKPKVQLSGKTFPKGAPQELNYENVSTLLDDMKAFAASVKALDRKTIRTINDGYTGVLFQTTQKPLFLNVYPDPTNKAIIFLLLPKDPQTGSNYLLKFDKNLPAVGENIIELQIRTKDEQTPLNCTLPVPDAAAYMQEYRTHSYEAKYIFRKQFIQSGTFDFDALTYPAYRTRGYPFIVFDLTKTEITDTTAHLACECRQ